MRAYSSLPPHSQESKSTCLHNLGLNHRDFMQSIFGAWSYKYRRAAARKIANYGHSWQMEVSTLLFCLHTTLLQICGSFLLKCRQITLYERALYYKSKNSNYLESSKQASSSAKSNHLCDSHSWSSSHTYLPAQYYLKTYLNP